MRIDKQLNLIISLFNDDGDPDAKPPRPYSLRAKVHSASISTETYHAHFEIIGQVFTKIHTDRYHSISAPKVAYRLLQKIAVANGIWESDPRKGLVGVKEGLVGEIHRLTNILAPTEKGWRDLMYEEALEEGVLSPEEAEEVDSMLVFFTVGSRMYPRLHAKRILNDAMSLQDAQVEYLSFMEFKASPPTSTADGNSGGTAA
jgi:hypothetical protein